MSTRDLSTDRVHGCVAGLFDDDAKAEQAVDGLRKGGFPEREIGVATIGGPDTGRHTSFWHKVTGMFEKDKEVEHSDTLKGSLTGCGIDDTTADYFDRALRDGDVLITVVCDGGREVRAREILAAAGADLGMATAGAERRPLRPVASPAADRNIQLRGEVLRARKERVGTGEVRLRKEVVSEKQHLEVPVEREELVIERAPGGGREASGPVGADAQEIRVPISEERVKVEKQPVVNEEVRVRKEPVHETKRVEGEVRHEELRTEHKGDVPVRGDIKEKDKRVA